VAGVTTDRLQVHESAGVPEQDLAALVDLAALYELDQSAQSLAGIRWTNEHARLGCTLDHEKQRFTVFLIPPVSPIIAEVGISRREVVQTWNPILENGRCCNQGLIAPTTSLPDSGGQSNVFAVRRKES